MKRFTILALSAALLFAAGVGSRAQSVGALTGRGDASAADEPWRVIDVAIVLDTSGSMEFLIEAARIKLWEIVHQLDAARPRPVVRAAVVSYGSQSNGAAAGWVRVEADFTSDLDGISDALMSVVQDHGGTEYVTRAVREAVNGLSWTPSAEALKLLFVAGNERADQDADVALVDAAALALDEQIALQMIFCGRPDAEDAESWRELAELAEGGFATIDTRSAATVIETPYDAELLELGSAINRTFVPLGEGGEERLRSLAEQDRRVRELSPAAAAARAEVKSGRLYAGGWELVAALEAGEIDMASLDRGALPAELRSLGAAELDSHLAELSDLRGQVRRRIQVLSDQRRAFIQRQIEVRGIDTSRSFDRVVLDALRVRLADHGFHVAAE